MSKKFYPDQDINDLIEEDLEKGGPGSGVKGHKTDKFWRVPTPPKRSEVFPKLMQRPDGSMFLQHRDGSTKDVKIKKSEDINDIIEAEEEAFFKGGVGSGIRGHKTYHPDSPISKVKQSFGSNVEQSTDGRIFVAFDSRLWPDAEIKSRIPKSVKESHSVNITSKITNGRKWSYLTLTPKPEAKTVDQELVNEYVNKFKTKHPEGMGAEETKKWLSGAGLSQSEVDAAMEKLSKPKMYAGKDGKSYTVPESDNSAARSEDEERDNELAEARKQAKKK